MKLKFFEKIAVVLLIIVMNGFGIFGIIESFAFFEDKNISEQNSIGAKLLAFSLDSDNDFHPEIKPDQKTSRYFLLQNDQNLDINYDILISTNGGSILCSKLDLEVKRNNILLYDGNLFDFGLFNLSLSVSESDNFEIIASLTDDSESLWGKQCDFDLLFKGEQENGGGFSDSKTLANEIVSGVWEDDEGEEALPEVVINEIMWMGSMRNDKSYQENDEWIELRNTTDNDINIGKWKISNAKKKNKEYMIPANKIIPANGYFLIANNPEESANSNLNVVVDQSNAAILLEDDYSANGQLILKDSEDNIIDITPDIETENWSEGRNEDFRKWSMARNSSPGDGSSTDNWHTCNTDIMSLRDIMIMKNYFKTFAGDYNCGTPGNPNLEEDNSAINEEAGVNGFRNNIKAKILGAKVENKDSDDNEILDINDTDNNEDEEGDEDESPDTEAAQGKKDENDDENIVISGVNNDKGEKSFDAEDSEDGGDDKDKGEDETSYAEVSNGAPSGSEDKSPYAEASEDEDVGILEIESPNTEDLEDGEDEKDKEQDEDHAKEEDTVQGDDDCNELEDKSPYAEATEDKDIKTTNVEDEEPVNSNGEAEEENSGSEDDSDNSRQESEENNNEEKAKVLENNVEADE